MLNFRDLMVHDEYEQFLTDTKNSLVSEMQIQALSLTTYCPLDFDFDEQFVNFLNNTTRIKLKDVDSIIVFKALISRANSKECLDYVTNMTKLFKSLELVSNYIEVYSKPVKKGELELEQIFSDEYRNMANYDLDKYINDVVLFPLITILLNNFKLIQEN